MQAPDIDPENHTKRLFNFSTAFLFLYTILVVILNFLFLNDELGSHYVDQDGLELLAATCFCFPNAVIDGVNHHGRPILLFLVFLPTGCVSVISISSLKQKLIF